MIKVEQLSKYYDRVKAVDNISFEIAEQENLVLLGTSGCGKTTTLKMLNRLIEPTAGKIFINGNDVSSQLPEQLRRGIGYVLQNHGLFPHYTVAENIAVVPKLLKWDAARIRNRTHELLEKLRLPVSLLDSYPDQLSGGQQQRVGLARALVADAPVLLMDEPFGALDNVTRAGIQAEFKELDELQRKTIVMVTHDVQEAFELGNRICLMDKGRIEQLGTPAQLLFNPASQFVKDFLQAQRLQLELKAVTLKQVWHMLPTGYENAGGVNTLSGTASIWQGMEMFNQTDAHCLTALHKGEAKSITAEQLTAAFYQFKNSTQPNRL